jgi:hypothetical protein
MGSKSFQHNADTAVVVGHYSAPLALSLANIAVYCCRRHVRLDRKFPAERLKDRCHPRLHHVQHQLQGPLHQFPEQQACNAVVHCLVTANLYK